MSDTIVIKKRIQNYDKKIEISEKFQGEQRLIDFLEENEDASNFLYEDFKKLVNAI